jgi:hypothetical protein
MANLRVLLNDVLFQSNITSNDIQNFVIGSLICNEIRIFHEPYIPQLSRVDVYFYGEFVTQLGRMTTAKILSMINIVA